MNRGAKLNGLAARDLSGAPKARHLLARAVRPGEGCLWITKR